MVAEGEEVVAAVVEEEVCFALSIEILFIRSSHVEFMFVMLSRQYCQHYLEI